MALPPSGPISLNQVNVELGFPATQVISLGGANVRALAGVPSGPISMSNLYGKSNEFSFSITANQTNANLRALAVAAGWNQESKVNATINNDVVISSNSTGTAALVVNGTYPKGVALINNGTIVGMGGGGGNGGYWQDSGEIESFPGAPGGPGGLALLVASAISINNGAGTIAGGGGGGGGAGGYASSPFQTTRTGGGGGGGGRSSAAANSGGGAGGYGFQGNGGPGAAGTYASPGNGGGTSNGGPGGSGGSWGSAGGAGNSNYTGAGQGGAGGQCVTGNINIDWIATGTRLGGIS